MNFISVRNWTKFQHYKSRTAPWLKFYRDMLDTPFWIMENDASKLLAVCLLVLALRTDNKIPADPKYILKFAHLEAKAVDFAPLLRNGFIDFIDENGKVIAPCTQDASDVLASCKRAKESRAEQSINTLRQIPAFEAFWLSYPRKKNKAAALRAWVRINPKNGMCEKIMDAVQNAKSSSDWLKDNGQFIPHPATWLNKGGWMDEQQAPESRMGKFVI